MLQHLPLRNVLRLCVPFALLLGAALPAKAALFTVTRFDDQLDTLPGDGLCDTLGGGCALRAAIQEANSLFGPDSIYLPPGTYSLTRAGAGEDLAATGDLDVTSEVILLGTGWGVSSIFMANFNDRLFEVHGFSSLVLGDIDAWGGSVDGIGGGVFVRPAGRFAWRAPGSSAASPARAAASALQAGWSRSRTRSSPTTTWWRILPPGFHRGPGPTGEAEARSSSCARASTTTSSRTSRRSSTGSMSGRPAFRFRARPSSMTSSAYSVRATDSDVEIVSSTVGYIQFKCLHHGRRQPDVGLFVRLDLQSRGRHRLHELRFQCLPAGPRTVSAPATPTMMGRSSH